MMSGHYPNRGLGCKAAEQGVSWAEVKVRAVLDEQ